MTPADAIQIARKAAFEAGKAGGVNALHYLPTTVSEALNWTPHAWVVDAMLQAVRAPRGAQALDPLQHADSANYADRARAVLGVGATGLALVLEAWDNAQFDSHNLAAVPSRVRLALYALLDELRSEYEYALFLAGVQIWASMQRRRGDPCWAYNGHLGDVRT